MFERIEESFKHKPVLYGNYGTRNSFISNYHAKVQGVLLGATFNKQFTLALGYNWLKTEFESIQFDGVKTKLKLRYISPFMEYSFLEHNNIEVKIPVYLGFGVSLYESEKNKKYNQQFIMLYEPAMTVSYRLFKYFGVSAGLGYRVVLIGNSRVSENFNSPTYNLGAFLFFGDIYRDTKSYFKK